MTEIWKDVDGYSGLYQVSNFGNVKSLSKHVPCKSGKTRKLPEKILKPAKTDSGYFVVCLSKNKISKHYKIHRLVASAFIENKERKKCVNHIDGDKTNNNVSNLEWCTYSENMKHAFSNGLWKPWNKGIQYHRKDRGAI